MIQPEATSLQGFPWAGSPLWDREPFSPGQESWFWTSYPIQMPSPPPRTPGAYREWWPTEGEPEQRARASGPQQEAGFMPLRALGAAAAWHLGTKLGGWGRSQGGGGGGVWHQEEKLLEMKSVHFIPEECSLFSWQQS